MVMMALPEIITRDSAMPTALAKWSERNQRAFTLRLVAPLLFGLGQEVVRLAKLFPAG